MIELVKYIKPNWYFNLKPKVGNNTYWLDLHKIPEAWKAYVEPCSGYRTEAGRQWDAAYQLWAKGLIADKPEWRLDESLEVPIDDQYRFVKRYYSSVWLYIIALMRIVEFKNPIKEIKGLLAAKKIQRVDTATKPFSYDYDRFESELVKQQPLVSVIIPTLNRYKYLEDVLADMDKQHYPNIEILVVDQSEPFQEAIYQNRKRQPIVWQQQEKALWLARNSAIERARGEYILLYDDDSLVESDWVEQHLKCLDFFQCEISSGVSLSVVGSAVPKHYSYFRWSDQIDTGNVMLHRKVFEQIGLFDRQFEKQRMGDGEFGLRAYLSGFKNISNPFAKRIHLKVTEGGLRQMGHWDAWRPKNFFAPRPIPSVLYLIRRYFGNAAAVRSVILALLPSIVPYRFKGNKLMVLLGACLGILTLPLLFVSVYKSWQLANVKCQQGPLIKSLAPRNKPQ